MDYKLFFKNVKRSHNSVVLVFYIITHIPIMRQFISLYLFEIHRFTVVNCEFQAARGYPGWAEERL